ncbi:zinc finger protein OZF-like isoform X1 [Cydia splendana]|uniref:zinc finger protein OZF-like isoform X1 n=1 Tax=Cydia splendana TaxID=1100963 RepID=UPI0021315AAE
MFTVSSGINNTMYTVASLGGDIYNHEYFLLEDVCRLCWKRNATQELLCKSEDNETEYSIPLFDQIRDCLDIILTHECRPNKVCTGCSDEVKRFYEFKKFCLETDKKLREILQNYVKIAEKSSNNSECYIKVENELPTGVEQDESFDDFLESLQQSDSSENVNKQKKVKLKQTYKPKRSPTYCNICRLDFKTVEQFSLHNSQNHGIEGNFYKCFGCEKRFKSRKTRIGHEINFCKGLKDGYRCTLCDRCLPKRRTYEAHMRDHRENVAIELPEELFKCKKCCISFKTREGLKEHVAEHETAKKYVCESCGRVFTRQDYLHKHKLTHTGTKQHVCPHCGFRSTQRSSLIVHIRKHTGERPYSCDMCPQRCISSSNLRAHRRRHLGLKKFQCTICDKKFGYKVSLEEHIESSHHRSQTHPCPHCGAHYSRKRGLKRHLTAKHCENEPSDEGDKVDSLLKVL